MEVTVIKHKREAYLVEFYEDGVQNRVTVPESFVKEVDGKFYVDNKKLDMGIPYGLPWADELEPFCIDPAELDRRLKENGVWTVQDALQNPSAVTGAVFSCVSGLIAKVNKIVKEYRSEKQGEIQ